MQVSLDKVINICLRTHILWLYHIYERYLVSQKHVREIKTELMLILSAKSYCSK